MKRSEGERIRLAHQIEHMRVMVGALELALTQDVPITETAQAVADTGVRLVSTAARLDAYRRSELGS